MQNPSNKIQPQNETEAMTDEWHYLADRDGKHDATYVEWKYFNFKQRDIAGYIVYWIIDPEKKTWLGSARLLARVFCKDKFSGAIREIPVNEVQFEPSSAGVNMGGAKILETDQHNYKISGNVENFSWDLHYQQEAPSINAFKNESMGVLGWEKADWLVKMPRAKVTGTILTAEGQIDINALGYSDTNWGEFLPFISKYEWGQYNDERISFVFGLLYKMFRVKGRYFYLIIDNKIQPLENPKFSIKHKKWGKASGSNIKAPLESEFLVQDKQFIIRFTSRLINSDMMALEVFPLLPKSGVSEQIVEYKGTIEKNGQLLCEFSGLGFQEWSLKTYKKPPIIF